MDAGAYLGGGGIVPCPPLWVARIAKLHRKVSKIEAWPPPPLCKLGIRFDHTKGIFGAFLLGFMLEIGLHLSEDLFFFCSSPDFGRKIGPNLSEDLFFVLHLILGEKSDQIWVKTYFFCSSPDFGRKIGPNLSEDLFFCSSPDFGRKIGPNLSKDLFFLPFTWFWAKNRTKFEWRPFFALHLILGEKSDWFRAEQFLIQTFALLIFSEVSGPPFSKSCIRYCVDANTSKFFGWH